MISTIVALLASLFLFYQFYPVAANDQILMQSTLYGSWFVFLSAMLLILALMAYIATWKIVWKTQEKKIACAQEFFVKDRWVAPTFALLVLFLLFSLSFVLLAPSAHAFDRLVWVCLWVFSFGVGVDVLWMHCKRLFGYTRNVCLFERLSRAVLKAVRDEKESEAVEWIGIAMDSVLKAMQQGKITYVSKSFVGMHELVETYVKQLARMQSLAPATVAEVQGPSFSDKINFLSLFVSERLQWLYQNAVRLHAHPVAEEVLSEFAKLALFFSRHNERVAMLCVSFITKCALFSKNEDALIRASLTLSQLCKEVYRESRERRESLRDLLLNALFAAEQIVKELYKKNKEINPALLMQPFAEIAQFLGQAEGEGIPERQEVLKEIRRILASFQSLELVIQNLEPVTTMPEDTTSTYSQDLPY